MVPWISVELFGVLIVPVSSSEYQIFWGALGLESLEYYHFINILAYLEKENMKFWTKFDKHFLEFNHITKYIESTFLDISSILKLCFLKQKDES